MLIELPIELIDYLINEYLSYEDTINLKLTCKKLRNIIDNRKILKVNIFLKSKPFNRLLFNRCSSVGYSNSISIENEKLINSLKFKEIFKSIKKLIFLQREQTEYGLIDLDQYFNCFSMLEHLEIYVQIARGSLKLNKLKTLIIWMERYVTNKERKSRNLKLDCEKLINLTIYGDINEIEIVCLNNLIYLNYFNQTHFIKSVFDIEIDKQTKKNLKCFFEKCPNLETLGLIDFKIFLYIQDLIKKKEINSQLNKIKYGNGVAFTYDFLEYILDQSSIFKLNNNIKIYCYELDITSIEFKTYLEIWKNNKNMTIRSFISDSNNINNYPSIVEKFYHLVPSIFLTDKDRDFLTRNMIKNLCNLNSITFNKYTLDSQIINVILKECKYLESLTLFNVKCKTKIEIDDNYTIGYIGLCSLDCDLDFIANFKTLYYGRFSRTRLNKKFIYSLNSLQHCYPYTFHLRNLILVYDKLYYNVYKEEGVNYSTKRKLIEKFNNLNEFEEYVYKIDLFKD